MTQTTSSHCDKICFAQECLKQHLSAGQNGSQKCTSNGCILPGLAHSLTAEYLENAQVKYTLPVFLSETCQSKQLSHMLTPRSVLDQLGISKESSFGRAFTSYTISRPHASSQGERRSPLGTAALSPSLHEADQQPAFPIEIEAAPVKICIITGQAVMQAWKGAFCQAF